MSGGRGWLPPGMTPRRALAVAAKVRWCAQYVGFRQTAAGVGRFVRLTATRPTTTTIRARTGDLLISLRYPAQLIPTLVVFGDLLEPELALVDQHLSPSDVAVDIGASVGTWSMRAALTGARVHACEPDVENLDVLRHNLRANNLEDRVTVHEAAIGENSGYAYLNRHERRYLNRVSDRGQEGERVEVFTLGDFLEREAIPEVGILKVNTAGNEASVLKGAAPVFLAKRVKLAMFLDGVALREALEELELPGYSVGMYDGERGRLLELDLPFRDDVSPPSPMNHYLVIQRQIPRVS